VSDYPRSIAVKQSTFERLQAIGTGLQSSPLGTPDKVLNAILDACDGLGVTRETLLEVIADRDAMEEA
jgi:hypothetical protein